MEAPEKIRVFLSCVSDEFHKPDPRAVPVANAANVLLHAYGVADSRGINGQELITE